MKRWKWHYLFVLSIIDDANNGYFRQNFHWMLLFTLLQKPYSHCFYKFWFRISECKHANESINLFAIKIIASLRWAIVCCTNWISHERNIRFSSNETHFNPLPKNLICCSKFNWILIEKCIFFLLNSLTLIVKRGTTVLPFSDREFNVNNNTHHHQKNSSKLNLFDLLHVTFNALIQLRFNIHMHLNNCGNSQYLICLRNRRISIDKLSVWKFSLPKRYP